MSALKNFNKSLSKLITESTTETLEKLKVFLAEKLSVEVDTLTTHFDEFKSTNLTGKDVLVGGDTNTKKEKKTRPPSKYNLFIKDKMKELKENDPSLKGQDLMKLATKEWNAAKASV